MRRAATICSLGRYRMSNGGKSHFQVGEFRCPCGKCLTRDVDQDLIDGLEILRLHVGGPIRIISGIRCPDHNAAVGGKPRSQHLPDEDGIGGAADIAAACGSGMLYLLSLRVPQLRGRGLGPTTLHVDARPQEAQWGYAKHDGERPDAWIAALIEKDWKS